MADKPTRQQKVRDVRTTDEEKHHGCCHQDPQSILGISQHSLAQKSHAEDVIPICCGKFTIKISANGREVLLSFA